MQAYAAALDRGPNCLLMSQKKILPCDGLQTTSPFEILTVVKQTQVRAGDEGRSRQEKSKYRKNPSTGKIQVIDKKGLVKLFSQTFSIQANVPY
jgi:hypothetical protein